MSDKGLGIVVGIIVVLSIALVLSVERTTRPSHPITVEQIDGGSYRP